MNKKQKSDGEKDEKNIVGESGNIVRKQNKRNMKKDDKQKRKLSTDSAFMLVKMAAGNVPVDVKQRCIIKFLVKEKVKPAEVLRRLEAQFGEQTLSRERVYDWCRQFSKGRSLVTNDPHRNFRPTAVTPANIARVEQVILDNRRITVQNIAAEMHISVGSVETIISDHLHFPKVCAK